MLCRLPTSSRLTAVGHGSDSRAGVADSTPSRVVVVAAAGGGAAGVSRLCPGVPVHAVSTIAISTIETAGLISGCYCWGSERRLEEQRRIDHAFEQKAPAMPLSGRSLQAEVRAHLVARAYLILIPRT